jgi:hypothetical protein
MKPACQNGTRDCSSFRLSSASLIRLGATIAAGAALIHVIEYHLGLGFNGQPSARLRVIAYMIERCPLRGPLAAVIVGFAVVAVATAVTMTRQLARLHELDARRRPTRRMSLRSPGPNIANRGDRRHVDHGHLHPPIQYLAGVWLLLAVGQLALFSLAQHLAPMHYIMEMHGVQMVMTDAPPVPLAPLSFVLAGLGALLLARCERRLHVIERAIAERLRVLYDEPVASFIPDAPRVSGALALTLGPAILSRPPPLFSSLAA